MRKQLLFLLLFLPLLVSSQMVINSYRYESGPVQDPNDIFPSGNAASFDDTASVGGFTNQGNGVVDYYDGGSEGNVIRITSTSSTASQGAYINITGVNSAIDYDMNVRYRVSNDVSSTQVTRAWVGAAITNGVSGVYEFNDDGSWHDETIQFNPSSSTVTVRLYSTRLAASGANVLEFAFIEVVPQ